MTGVVPDESRPLGRDIHRMGRAAMRLDLILSTGGTGLAPRDVTPEAAMRVIQRPHPGLMELARMRCYGQNAAGFPLARAWPVSSIGTLHITLPGSPRGSRENLEALLDILPHAIETLAATSRTMAGPEPLL